MVPICTTDCHLGFCKNMLRAVPGSFLHRKSPFQDMLCTTQDLQNMLFFGHMTSYIQTGHWVAPGVTQLCPSLCNACTQDVPLCRLKWSCGSPTFWCRMGYVGHVVWLPSWILWKYMNWGSPKALFFVDSLQKLACNGPCVELIPQGNGPARKQRAFWA